MTTENSFVKLAAINVNEHIEKKGGLSYLSWPWAVDQLLRADSAANWSYVEPRMYGETMMVGCIVTAFGIARQSHLPVMDHRNKPIPNPDAFQVNTAMQRCLVKAIALHGLGLYIYAGEDLPMGGESNGEEPEPPRPITGAQLNKEAFEALPEPQQKVLHTMSVAIIDLHTNREPMLPYIDAHIAEDDSETRMGLWFLLPSDTRAAIKAEQSKARAK